MAYKGGYRYRAVITIPAGTVSADVSDAYAPLRLTGDTRTAFLNIMGTGGSNRKTINFKAQDDSTQLNAEIENWVQCAFFVRIPTVYSASDTIVYLYWRLKKVSLIP